MSPFIQLANKRVTRNFIAGFAIILFLSSITIYDLFRFDSEFHKTEKRMRHAEQVLKRISIVLSFNKDVQIMAMGGSLQTNGSSQHMVLEPGTVIAYIWQLKQYLKNDTIQRLRLDSLQYYLSKHLMFLSAVSTLKGGNPNAVERNSRLQREFAGNVTRIGAGMEKSELNLLKNLSLQNKRAAGVFNILCVLLIIWISAFVVLSLVITKKYMIQSREAVHSADALTQAVKKNIFQRTEKKEQDRQIIDINHELEVQQGASKQQAVELNSANVELAFRRFETNKRAAELIIANAELHFQNIEKEKALEEKEKMSADIIQRGKNIEQFSQIVSHNLRGPVANILGISNVLKGEVTDANREYMQNSLFKAVEQMDEVVKDLNRILQAKLEGMESTEMVLFSEVAADTESGLHELIKKENVSITTDFSATNGLVTIKSYICSIFYNLILNAIKFKQEGKRPEIIITSEVQEGCICLSFKDKGLGMNMDEVGEKIFGAYNRFHCHIEGKGLGLFMVKTQVELLNGNIAINSHPGLGTEFTIRLPLS